MTANIRFSWLRPGGWNRLGLAGAIAILFGTPMLWAAGKFGLEQEGLRRAAIFLASGLCLFPALGVTVGWAVRGFVVRIKEPEEEERTPSRPGMPPRPAEVGAKRH